MSWFEKPAEAPARVPTEAIWAVCPSCKVYVARKRGMRLTRSALVAIITRV